MEDLHKKWPHRWITPKANPDQQGKLFAKKEILKGEVVAIFGGIIIPKEEITEYRNILGHAGFQIEENFFIGPSSKKEMLSMGIFNHSCDPNCGHSNSPIKLISIKKIPINEFLTVDYAFGDSMFNEFKCECDSKNCRKIIKPTDWQNSDLQKKYKNYFSPYLRNKISKT